MGYDPELSKFKKKNDFVIHKVKIDTFIYDVPDFLISKKVPDDISKNLIKKSLYFTRNIIQNKFFMPNNLVIPKSRVLLENYFN